MILKQILIIAVFSIVLITITGCQVFWTSPPYYITSQNYELQSHILSNDEYSNFGYHQRPYIYKVKGRGQAIILGLEHSKDETNHELDSVKHYFEKYNPTVVLIEGRLGFLFRWFQNPINQYGEQGFTADLAKENDARLYTWEPTNEDKIRLMIEKYDAKKVALLYSLRPYFSNFRYGKPSDPNEMMNEYIQSRTRDPMLNGKIKNWREVDSVWKADYPLEKDWRDFSDEWGWPAGYLSEMADYDNLIRDIHLCNSIIEMVNNGETVIVTMGSSHAVRIKSALTKYFLFN